MHYIDLLPAKGLACIVGASPEDKPTGSPVFFDLESPDTRGKFDEKIAALTASRRGVFVCYYSFLDKARLTSKSRANAGADASHLSLVCDIDVDPAKPECFGTLDEVWDALAKIEAALPCTAIVSSGGGLHLYWRLSAALPHNKRTAAQESLRGFLHGIDPRIVSDPRRMKDAGVLRPPGSMNFKAKYGPAGSPVMFIHESGPTHDLAALLAVCAAAVPSPALHPGDAAMAARLAMTPAPVGAPPTENKNEGRFQRGSYALSAIASDCALFRTYLREHRANSPVAVASRQTRNDGAAWEVILQLGSYVLDAERTMHAIAHRQDYATPDDAQTISKRMAGWRAPPSCRRMREALLGVPPEVAGVATNCGICARCPLAVSDVTGFNTPLDAIGYASRAASVAAAVATFTPAPNTTMPQWPGAVELNRAASLDFSALSVPPAPLGGDTLVITDTTIRTTRTSGKTASTAQGFRTPEFPLYEAQTESGDSLYVIARLAPGQDPPPSATTYVPRAIEHPVKCELVETRSSFRNKMMQQAYGGADEAARVFNTLMGMAIPFGRITSSCTVSAQGATLPACRVTSSGEVLPVLWPSAPDLLKSPGFVGTFDEHRAVMQWVIDHAQPEAMLAAICAFVSPLYALMPENETTTLVSVSGKTGTGKTLLAEVMSKVWDTGMSRVSFQNHQAGATANALPAMIQRAGALPVYGDELRLMGEGLGVALMGLTSGGTKARMTADAGLRQAPPARRGMLISLSNITDLYDTLCAQTAPALLGATLARVVHLNIEDRKVFAQVPPANIRIPCGVFGANYARTLLMGRRKLEGEVGEALRIQREGASQRFDVLLLGLVRIACDILRTMGLRVDTVYARVKQAVDIADGERAAATTRAASVALQQAGDRGVRMLIQPAVVSNSPGAPSRKWMASAGAHGRILSIEVQQSTPGAARRLFLSTASFDLGAASGRGQGADARALVESVHRLSAPLYKDDITSLFQVTDPTLLARMVDQYYEVM